jgi:hypothetical protein
MLSIGSKKHHCPAGMASTYINDHAIKRLDSCILIYTYIHTFTVYIYIIHT